MENENLEQNIDINLDDVDVEQEVNKEDTNNDVNPDVFNPENIEFEDEYNFGGYNLTKFKENLNLNEDNVKVLDSMTAKYSELGLTQEQVEGVIGLMIDKEVSSQSPVAIKETLNKNLTFEEKRAYKANCNLLKQALAGTAEEKFFDVLTSDPTAVKILGKVINHIKGGGKSVNSARTERETREDGRLLSGTQGVETFNEFLKTGTRTIEEIESKKKEVRGKLKNQDEVNYFNEIIGN